MTKMILVPEDWEAVPLTSLMNIVYRYPSYYRIEYQEKGVPEIRGEMLLENGEINNKIARFISKETANRFPKTKLLCDDLVISVRGTMGKVGLVRKYLEGATITANLMRLSPNRELVVSDFLKYYLLSSLFNIRLNELSPQTTIKTIQAPILKSIKVPLPPVPEQRKIASVLSTIQEAKEKTENVIRATKELKKSMMKYLFTYGPVSVKDAEKVPLKETEIGMIPEHWEIRKLGDIATQRKESTIPIGNGEYIYVGLEHIDSGEIRLKRHGFDNEVRSSKYRFYKGDILYGKLRPYLDKCVLVDFEGICSTDIIVVTHSKEVQRDYLANLIHMDGLVKYATQTMTGVNHPRTSWKSLSLFKVPYPSLTEQQQISEILTAIDKKIEAEEAKKNSLEALFKTLLSLLMTGKIRVKDSEIPV